MFLYDKYAREYHREKNHQEKIDHGILGGMLLFQNGIRAYKKEKCDYCEMETVMRSAITIAQHNIYKSPNKETDQRYPQNLLEKLACESDFRIDMKTPLLLLLSIVDTVECAKKLGRPKKSAHKGEKGLSVQNVTILKKIYVEVDNERILLDYSRLYCHIKKECQID